MSYRFRLLLPLLVVVAAVVGYPLVYSLYLSLTDYRLTDSTAPSFVGLAQYQTVLTDPGFLGAMTTTLVYVLIAVAGELVLGLALALALQRQRRVRDLTRAVLLAPMFVTPIAVGLMFRFLLNDQLGVLPALLDTVGVSIDFFGPGRALLTLAAIDIWQWTPFMVLLLLAGLESLPRQPFEAARIDGASRLYTFRRVTLPMLVPVMVVAVLIRSLDALKVFEYVFAITRGGPGTETQTIQYYAYQTGIQFFRLGQASAMAFVLLVVVLTIVVVLFRRVEKGRAA